ncbi:MAG: ATP-dependent acyl-CoA ligase, partial [Oscillatoriales cyanobacterium RU_3_3]|nr:ATP-dependent acyl-CoA ligase [Oscillatoriales cyanobacterium RU_3_3]
MAVEAVAVATILAVAVAALAAGLAVGPVFLPLAAPSALVARVAVVAVPDEIREEEVMACVVAMPGARVDTALAERLCDFCLERLAYFKAPGWVLFVESLPTTGTQKVQKAADLPSGRGPAAEARGHG